ncbi:hypothetical protein BDP27DRAFT_1417961 [Rhodocollybia butyracea]|uniref:Uncharacterized protein n=1 Tax=Rhodocollybia butyracea TaxID=206335 RepID=A0A9P5PUF9_9AGAR|nr:hypothetical protein BDP27DRAFT_1417961 [Rhodocollybia butyracea]
MPGSAQPQPICQITVSNEANFAAEIAVSGENYGVELGKIEAEAKNVVFDLSKPVYVSTGSPFQVRVWISPYANDTTDTWVVYSEGSESEAVYVIGGSADKPTILFERFRPLN